MTAEPPLATGAINETVAVAFPATAVTPVGAPGTMLIDEYVRFDGFDRPPLFVGVSVIVPDAVGVIEKVFTVSALNVRITADSPKPAVGVIVIVPVYA